MLPKFVASLKSYTHPKLRIILLLGFSSGLPLVLTFSTLSAWLGDVGVDKSTIGFFALVGIAYSFNYLWAPLVDHIKIPVVHRLGRRRGWMLATQVVLMAAIAAMGMTNPLSMPVVTALCAVVVAFASATQDIVIDAYRTEILDKEQFGEGAAAGVFGYRLGMLVAGAGALLIADNLNWHMAYLSMAACVAVGMAAVLFAKEPQLPEDISEPEEHENVAVAAQKKIKQAVIDPFIDFTKRKGWWLLLLFILCSKLSDAFAGFMINPFLLEIGFTKTELAEIGKIYGFLATTAGTIIGAALIRKYGIIRSLWVCIPFQMAANLVYMAQVHYGGEIGMLMLSISADNLSAGMAISSVIAFMMSLCNIRYTATQYALLSSLAGMGRTLLASTSGVVAENYGWINFFIVSGLMGIPALVALWFLPRYVDIAAIEREK